jgi:hypothetical protein
LGTPKSPKRERAVLGPTDAAGAASKKVLGSFGEFGEVRGSLFYWGQRKVTDERGEYLKLTEKEKELLCQIVVDVPPRKRAIWHFFACSTRYCPKRRST